MIKTDGYTLIGSLLITGYLLDANKSSEALIVLGVDRAIINRCDSSSW